MTYLNEFLIVGVIHLLAVMSPGPDFAIVVRNSLVYTRKVGMATSCGIALGLIVHIAYSLMGIGFIISQSIVLFSMIKLLGAAYLIYIGYKSLTARKEETDEFALHEQKELSAFKAVWTGFLTNVLNPKVTLFFLSLFTLVISPVTPTLVQLLYGVEMIVMTFVWFSALSIMLSLDVVRERFHSIQHYVEKVMGGVLIALGIKVAVSSIDN